MVQSPSDPPPRCSPCDRAAGPVCQAKPIVVVIPALNEEQSLPFVLRDLPPVHLVIVVDNGSTDATASVARRFAAHVVHEPQRGYGAACLAGLAFVRRQVAAAELDDPIVVFLDADYSDHPDLLTELTEPIARGDADLTLGSRLRGNRQRGAMPAQSVWGNRLACCLMSLLWQTNYTDLGPFRAIAWGKLEQLGMRDSGYGWTIEMQIKAARAKLRVKEVAVPYRCRIGRSKISGTLGGSVRAGAKILWTVARYGWQSWRMSRTG